MFFLPLTFAFFLHFTHTARGLDTIYDYTAKNAAGNSISLEKYRGNVVILANVASYCGYTQSNYEDFKYLEEKYYERGLRIALFPCNQFGQQEPDTLPQISTFISQTFAYEPEFFDKIHVSGPKSSDLFDFLQRDAEISWNFWKFLVNRQGVVVKILDHSKNPRDFEQQIIDLLGSEDAAKIEL
ncbi:unnamed protein product [Caenorhabditis angaria]|uniref:Glutathione peroxidase n=1 Tax=Caenorhabditis angaria TaxID=860376 RepID=A0A9P1IM21_9PELO|nr:unnamed protein product [Caenorhabditis angaria]